MGLESNIQDELSGIKCFRKLSRRVRLDTANPHQTLKRIRSEPLFVTLGLKASHQILNLPITSLPVEIHKNIGIAKIAIVFEDFVFENKVIAPGVPGQLVNHSMILMEIVASMREDQIGRQRVFQLFKMLFDFDCLRRKKPI